MDPATVYRNKIQDHARWAETGSPWAGESLTRLHAFLSNEADPSTIESTPAAKGFAWLYRLDDATTIQPQELADAAELDTYDRVDGADTAHNSLIILRGYPSAHWMLHLGAKYQVDPRFWLLHANFLSDTTNRAFESLTLPSSGASVMQFPLLTQGSHRLPHGEVNQKLIDTARRESRDAMAEYRHHLTMGTLWSPCASIVRNHWVLGEDDFCIEQLVSVALLPRPEAPESWVCTSLL